MSVPVQRLPRGVYTVVWSVVSAVDGHATDGTYSFGVGVSPTGAAASEGSVSQSSSRYELLARWVLIVGIVALLGGAIAAVAGFGGTTGSDLRLSAAGWLVSFAGLLLLADAQRRTAGSSLGDLLDTSIGRALVWRGLALAVAGVGLLVARRSPARRRPACAVVAAAALAAIVANVDAGHAAAGSWSSWISVTAQSAHFAAAAVWLGGLAALLLGTRGAASEAKAAEVRRFAAFALAMLVVVFLTGILRAVDELNSWGELLDSGYGRAILAKFVLLILIVALAAGNRRRNVPVASADLGPLRRSSRAEIALALLALGAAALLGTLAPPVGGQSAPPGLAAEGADFGTTTRVELTAASDRPGPNVFTARVEDYDSGDAVAGAGVSLRFSPFDDPGVGASTLKLEPSADGDYTASGANLAFDGRWSVVATVRRGDGTVFVPLELDLPVAEQFLSELLVPGEPPKYTLQIGSSGDIQIEVDPERAGPSDVEVICLTPFGSVSRVEQIVVTAGGEGPTRQQSVRRLGAGRFESEIELEAGPFEIGVVALTRDGTRLHGVFELDVPAG